MAELEDKILEKKVSFSIKDMKWVITTAVSVVLWIVTATLWVKDTNATSVKMDSLEKENGTLKTEVATLKGQVDGVNRAAEIFMKNSPSENRHMIESLGNRVDVLELPGSNPPPTEVVIDTSHVVGRSH
jgi:hypothetical protein